MTEEIYSSFKFFIHVKSRFGEKKFPSLVLIRISIIMKHVVIQFLFNYLSTGRLREIKNKIKFNLFSSKCGSWSLTRGVRLQEVLMIFIMI